MVISEMSTYVYSNNIQFQCKFNHNITSGYPWSDPIRLNNFSLALSLIDFFLYGLPGRITFVPGQDPGQNLWGGPVCQMSQM